MKELRILSAEEFEELKESANGKHPCYSIEYDEPLLEYVEILANKYEPLNIMHLQMGYLVTRAKGTFAIRYFENKINKSAFQKYENDVDVQKTVKAFGFDVDKFWYLIMFILDYSSGMSLTGFKIHESPKEQIQEFANGIVEYIKFNDEDHDSVTFNKPIKIILEREGKHKITIDNPHALFYMAEMCLESMSKIESGSLMDDNHIEAWENGAFKFDSLSDSFHIWYFTKMFLSFFELKPPIKAGSKRDSTISYNKLKLIAKLVFIVGLSKKISFKEADKDVLKGFLSKYNNSEPKMLNGIYWL